LLFPLAFQTTVWGGKIPCCTGYGADVGPWGYGDNRDKAAKIPPVQQGKGDDNADGKHHRNERFQKLQFWESLE
jgi:hypothetical protein